MHWVGFILDEIFFRGYRKIEIKEPLFIVGIPRSGTTLLHRTLAKDTENFTTFTLWELLFAPSICERKVSIGLAKLDRLMGNPVSKFIRWLANIVCLTFNHLNRINSGSRKEEFSCRSEREEDIIFRKFDNLHTIALDAPEEDYLVLIPIFACFLLILPFPFQTELWNLGYFDDKTSKAEKKWIMAFYRSCLQRHLFVRGRNKRLLSKNPAFSPMITTLKGTFPDCKVICAIRNPLSAAPSLISSMMEGAKIFDNDTQGFGFRDQLLTMLSYFYDHLITELSNWQEDQFCFVTTEELQKDLHPTVEKIYDRFTYQRTQKFENSLQQEHKRSQAYKSRHHYSLQQFGIDPESLIRRYSGIFDRFGFDRNI